MRRFSKLSLIAFAPVLVLAACEDSNTQQQAASSAPGTVQEQSAYDDQHHSEVTLNDHANPSYAMPPRPLDWQEYICGEQSIYFIGDQDGGSLRIENVTYAMERAVSASGERYQGLGDEKTVFWSKGSEATITVEGQELPPCQAVQPPDDSERVMPDQVIGYDWVLEDLNAGGVIDNSYVSIHFDTEGRFHGRAGCNMYNGAYELNEDQITIKPNIASTMMACAAEGLMNQEQRYLSTLPNAASVNLITEQGKLEVKNSDGNVILRYVAD